MDDLEVLAAEVVVLVQRAVTPVLERLAVAETKLALLGDVRDRVVAVETKAAVLEARPALPGPPGEPGPPGKDGRDGKDGLAGLSYEGVYQDGKSYDVGHLVTYAGSSWHCNEATQTKPGDGSKAWTLMVKRGRDGKDGADAQTLPVVTVGKR